jgi:hypothetical protein
MIYGVIYIEGDPCPITNMFDADCEETEDKSKAVTVVAYIDESSWASVEIQPSEILWVQ